ncbi:hypothetical protein AMATHDRAFT_10720 [Amanita thiersii Skay4041]|uniref:Uncharacterized protein n=1 Tax=Amanita thiersii Skay4041 TaxID=703135 RepID=A0A2A9N646_9AGAR|nr:hypothetical protein AMATHDRAFT_10720 [Amanita thiersii Skay4041]
MSELDNVTRTWLEAMNFDEMGLTQKANFLGNGGVAFILKKLLKAAVPDDIPIQFKDIAKLPPSEKDAWEVVEDKKVELEFIAGEYNPADLLTKNLANIKFAQFRKELSLEFYSD